MRLFVFTFFSLLYINVMDAIENDLEIYLPDCILETRRILIPQAPYAFNPSFIKYDNNYLMCYRQVQVSSCSSQESSTAEISFLEIIWLDENFNVISEPYPISLDHPDKTCPVFIAEDGRLISLNGRIYLVYSGIKEREMTERGFRVYVAELGWDGNGFFVISNECLSDFEYQNSEKREKNWVPFIYKNELYLAYSIYPHRILKPLLDGSGRCETITSSIPSIIWEWGELRGGTPAVPLSEELYLAFFHSSIPLTTIHSSGECVLHYFMGAYLFAAEPPFEIKQISPEPLIGKNFYHGTIYEPYWKPVRVVFPGGIIVDKEYIWIAYGRQDHETWIAKILKSELLDLLINVSTIY